MAASEPTGAGPAGPAGQSAAAGAAGPTGAAGPVAAPAPAGDPVRAPRRVRVRTVVFGLVVLVISVAVGVSIVSDVRVDAAAVGLALFIGAGLALVGGGLAAAVRETRSRAARPGDPR